MTSIVRISESFNLRKINVELLTKNFLAGEYKDRDLPVKKIKNNVTSVKIGKEIGWDGNSEIYQYKDRYNAQQTVYTTNHQMFEYAQNKTEFPLICCKYCKRKIYKTPIGIPISMITKYDKTEKSNMSEKQENKQENKGTKQEKRGHVTFNVLDNFCDFGCAFTFLKVKTGESRYYKSTIYMNAEQLLYCYYYRMYPEKYGQKIYEKPNWEYLRENGGSLSNEEFDGEKSEYIAVQSVVTLPVKYQFSRLNV